MTNVNKKKSSYFNKYNVYPYFFVAPHFLIFAIFGIFPIFFSFYLSFTDWNGFSPMKFVGLSNYIRMFTLDNSFFVSLYNTVLINIMGTPLTFGLALFFAYMYNFKLKKLKSMFQVMNFLPYITTPIAIGIIFSIVFDQNVGIINNILVYTGIIDQGIYWLGQPLTARIVVTLLNVWKWSGYASVYLLAGLASIREEVIEAAKIDGADDFTTFRKICIPMIKNIMFFLILASVIGGLQLLEEPMMLFSGMAGASFPVGGPDKSCLTMVWNFFSYSFNDFQMGYGAALAYSMSIIIGIISLFTIKIMSRGNDQ